MDQVGGVQLHLQPETCSLRQAEHIGDSVRAQHYLLSQASGPPDGLQCHPEVAGCSSGEQLSLMAPPEEPSNAARFLHPCVICCKSFSRKDRLKIHVRTVHENDRRYECDWCGKRFGRKDKMTRHFASVHQKSTFECPICGKVFTRKDKLSMHLNNVHSHLPSSKPAGIFGCPFCAKVFQEKYKLERHMKVHDRSLQSDAMTETDLAMLDSTSHPDGYAAQEPCLVAPHHTARKQRKKEHPAPIKMCGSLAAQDYQHPSDAHFWTQTGGLLNGLDISVLPMAAKVRGSGYMVNPAEVVCVELDQPDGDGTTAEEEESPYGHAMEENTHIVQPCSPSCEFLNGHADPPTYSNGVNEAEEADADRPFECELCGKRFGRKDKLSRHVASVHLKKTFECGICGKAFTRKDKLSRHRNDVHESHSAHSATTLIQRCCECAKVFRTKEKLEQHLILHQAPTGRPSGSDSDEGTFEKC